jgi:hypothetical protein
MRLLSAFWQRFSDSGAAIQSRSEAIAFLCQAVGATYGLLVIPTALFQASQEIRSFGAIAKRRIRHLFSFMAFTVLGLFHFFSQQADLSG